MSSPSFKVDDLVQFSTKFRQAIENGTRGVVTEVMNGACRVHFETQYEMTVPNSMLRHVDPLIDD